MTALYLSAMQRQASRSLLPRRLLRVVVGPQPGRRAVRSDVAGDVFQRRMSGLGALGGHFVADARNRIRIDVVHPPLGVVNRQRPSAWRKHREIRVQYVDGRPFVDVDGERTGRHVTEFFFDFFGAHTRGKLSLSRVGSKPGICGNAPKAVRRPAQGRRASCAAAHVLRQAKAKRPPTSHSPSAGEERPKAVHKPAQGKRGTSAALGSPGKTNQSPNGAGQRTQPASSRFSPRHHIRILCRRQRARAYLGTHLLTKLSFVSSSAPMSGTAKHSFEDKRVPKRNLGTRKQLLTDHLRCMVRRFVRRQLRWLAPRLNGTRQERFNKRFYCIDLPMCSTRLHGIIHAVNVVTGRTSHGDYWIASPSR
jgi:hypothetical protein